MNPGQMRGARGFTLIELSLSLAVALAMAGVVAALYLSTSQSNTLSTVRGELLQVTAAAAQLAANGQRAGMDTAAVANSGLVPAEMVAVVSSVTVLRHSAGGTITVGEVDISGATAARAIGVTVTGLDATRCTELVLSTHSRYDEVRVGGATGTTVKHALVSPEVQPDRQDVLDACEADADALFLFVQ